VRGAGLPPAWQSCADICQEDPLIVGVPREIKTEEHRVAMTPVGVRELVAHGHRVVVQAGAGEGSFIGDADYIAVGGEILPDAAAVFETAEMIVKVKEPQPAEIAMLGKKHLLFTYLHLAAYPAEAKGLLESGATAIAYETVQLGNGTLPLLAPMSEIAGRMAAQAGAHFLERPRGGRGILLGGVTGVSPGRVTVLGAGMAGRNAALIAGGMGADVFILDLNIATLRHVDELRWPGVKTITSSRLAVEQYVLSSDLVVGAVLVPGARAPIVVTEDMVKAMRPGSVIVDISIDQGGCIATAHETTHTNPTYVEHGVVHYAVGNIPGAVPHTATYALTNATLPYVVALAEGTRTAVQKHPELLGGLNVVAGKVTNAAVADFLKMKLTDPMAALSG
jgi:alanine dehydrogenase